MTEPPPVAPPSELEFSAVHAAAIDALKKQFLVVLVNRLGGKVDIPMAEVDATGQFLLGLHMTIDAHPTGNAALDAALHGVFHFEVKKKQ